jgi:hypothetical protein
MIYTYAKPIDEHIIVFDLNSFSKESKSSHNPDGDWSISAPIFDALNLIVIFAFYSFNWVRREANSVTHVLAKSLRPQDPPLSFNSDHLPLSIKEVWFRDVLSVIFLS